MTEKHEGSWLLLAAALAVSACSPDPPPGDDADGAIVYPASLETLYTASGLLGDAAAGELYVSIRSHRDSNRQRDHDGVVTRVEYSAGPAGWAGIAWLWPEGNMGQAPGRTLSARRVVFEARGETGRELVEFRVGGIVPLGGIGPVGGIGSEGAPPYRDSVERSTGGILLTREWKRYEIKLSGQDLSSVIGGFAWIVQARANTEPVTFYIDSVRFE